MKDQEKRKAYGYARVGGKAQEKRQGKAYGYGRVSVPGEGVSLEDQRGRVERHFEYKLQPEGLAWGGHFEDDGVSGKIGLRHRPQGAKLFAALEAGDCVVFTKLDRAFRNVLDMLDTLESLRKRGVRLIFLDLNADTNTDMGKMILTIFAAFAEFERARISERTREAFAAMKRKGYRNGPPPYGFKYEGRKQTRKLVHYPQEREVGAAIVRWRHDGWTLDAVVKHLHGLGVKLKSGRDYSRDTVWRHYWWELRLQAEEAGAVAVPVPLGVDHPVRPNGDHGK